MMPCSTPPMMRSSAASASRCSSVSSSRSAHLPSVGGCSRAEARPRSKKSHSSQADGARCRGQSLAWQGSACLLGQKQRRIVRGFLVEAGEHGLCSGRYVGCLVVVSGEGANVIKRVEDHYRRELDLIVKIAPQQVGAGIAVETA